MDNTAPSEEGSYHAKDGGLDPTAVGGIDDYSDPHHRRKGTSLGHNLDAVDRITGLKGRVNIICNSKEDSEEDCRVMALSNVFCTFFADHQAEDENNGTNGNGWD
mmetsp:Transcript_36692/g.79920  ORF Transcript_36692/g.79920 Transcript_36692/m.79920 type:complete len:105 (-) Transcript_36692:1229-1543(-)